MLALLLAIAAPSLDIIAYIPQFGNTDVQAAYDNILKLYGVLDTYVQQHPEHAHRFPNLSSGHGTGSTRPLLVKGASGPLGGKTHTAKYFHGADGQSLSIPLFLIFFAHWLTFRDGPHGDTAADKPELGTTQGSAI